MPKPPKLRKAVLIDGPNRYDITDRTVDPRGVHSFVPENRPSKYKPGEPKDPFADDDVVEYDNIETDD